jgi:hypothetical protein
MKKKRLIGVSVAAVFVLLAAAYLWGPGSAPYGQAPVVRLSEGKLGEFERAFDAEANVARLVLLLSPTCQRTGGRRVAARSDESLTAECSSSGTRSMSCPRN